MAKTGEWEALAKQFTDLTSIIRLEQADVA
jgi:hypothetical protein